MPLVAAMGRYAAALVACSSDTASSTPGDGGDETFGVPRRDAAVEAIDAADLDPFAGWQATPGMPCAAYVAPDPARCEATPGVRLDLRVALAGEACMRGPSAE